MVSPSGGFHPEITAQQSDGFRSVLYFEHVRNSNPCSKCGSSPIFVKDTIKEQGKKKLSAGGSREFLNMTEIEKSYRF